MVSGDYRAEFSPGLNRFVQVLEGYRPSVAGLRDLLNAARETGESSVRQAALGLQGLIKKNHGMPGTKRFEAKAPELYPTREQVVSHLLYNLSQSPDSRVRDFAAALAARWFKGIVARGDIGIYGKYV